ncbi:MAG: hypothetical protein CSB13_05900 [Chloroflexi bacterium]|nr:MAG: hypothetical protein CSB13_05900 [Chloroflexota bacterium]
MIPEKIGRYQIESELGRGGMATVYKAYDPRFERRVAIKVLPREFMHDPEFQARFNREAKTIAALEHPAIVPVYDYGEDDGLIYLVMRYMPGGSLADKLENGPFSIEESAKILQRLGSALDRAHSQNIIHRDLKPGNVLFDQYGNAYLADFGIVRVADSNSNLTASGSLVGTPMYMSPEQVYGDKELDGRSDIYALGIILFQMLTGHLPYEADTPAKLMMKHVLDPVPDILAQRPDLPPQAEQVVSKAMAKEPKDRFETASDFSSALSTLTSETAVSDGLRQQLTSMHADTLLAEEDLVDTPVDQAPASLAHEVFEDFEASLAAEKSVDIKASASKRKSFIWVWTVLIGLVASCISICVVAFFMIGQAEDNDWFDISKIGIDEPVMPTIISFPILDPDEAAAATLEAELVQTREQAALAATQDATLNPNEVTPDAVADSAEATRNSLLMTRNAVTDGQPEETTDLTEADVSATRVAVAEMRDETASEFPVPAVFGPANGGLTYSNDNVVEAVYAGVNLSNFVAQVDMVNPHSLAEDGWDFGFIFRQVGADEELRLVVRSDGFWSLNQRRAGRDNIYQEGTANLEYLNLETGDSNRLTLAAFDDLGLFFLNGNLISSLDLSVNGNFGDIGLGTDFYAHNKQAGQITVYENFTVWPFVPEFGPHDGELELLDDSFIRMHAAGVQLKNFVAEVEFINPYGEDVGSWDWGFAFRETEGEYWLIVDSMGAWTLIDRHSDANYYLGEGNVGKLLHTGTEEPNKLVLIAFDDQGYFFLNGELVAELPLSDRLDYGDVEVATAFFEGNEVPGYSTLYKMFMVWPLP